MSLAKMMAGGDEKSWKDFGLDTRLLHSIKRMKFKTPTLIQSSTIPLALAGKDILARASTGSGKTAAYTLPMCHKLLQSKGTEGKVRALVLVPSKELCNQVLKHCQQVLAHAEGALCVVDLSDIDHASEWSNQRCEICVATPSTALLHAKAGHVDLSELEVCVIDEADALLSHPTVKKLRCMYPTTTQSFLMSATLSPGVVKLKSLILNKPVVVKLEEEDDDDEMEEGAENSDEEAAQAPAIRTKTPGSNPNIAQSYVTYYNENEKYCFLYALVRFKQIEGKVLIFVDNIDKAYRLKLFLDKFSLRAAVLNADIPLNSRNHIVAQFNMGEYGFLIATDETMQRSIEESKKQKKGKAQKAKEEKAEYGVSRGIDFREVTAVVNFDAFELRTETGCKSYIHRIGRTGRAGKSGTAITFLPKSEVKSDGFLPYLNAYLASSNQTVAPHAFETDNREAMKLSYRTDDALLSIKKKMVKEAKVKELISEAVNSETLKQYFVENPNDLAALKHIKPQSRSETLAAASRAYVPTYLSTDVEGSLETDAGKKRAADSDSDDSDDQARKKGKKRKVDPLKTLKLAKAKPSAKKGPVKKKKFVGKKKAVAKDD